jgi:hypothetical protein
METHVKKDMLGIQQMRLEGKKQWEIAVVLGLQTEASGII